jgi:hypothetical protein
MNATTLMLLGVELAHLGGASSLSGVGSSLDVLEAGGWTLAPYEGPALQPTIGLARGPLRLSLAPGFRFHRAQVSAVDGRTGTAVATQWRIGARAWWGDTLFGGVDGAMSGGGVSLDGAAVAEGTPGVEFGPTMGVRRALVEGLDLVGRVRWTWRKLGDSTDHGLGAAVSLEWALG